MKNPYQRCSLAEPQNEKKLKTYIRNDSTWLLYHTVTLNCVIPPLAAGG